MNKKKVLVMENGQNTFLSIQLSRKQVMQTLKNESK